jgi:hypothetical protein
MFESYFSNRYQRVSITNIALNQNHFSMWQEIKHEVPQGSVLGPLLFPFYIYNLPKAINDKAMWILFADDTSILITSPNRNVFQLKLTTAFNIINEWLNTNLLSINFSKPITYNLQQKISPNLILTF